MSNQTNEKLLEEAAFFIDEFEGTLIADALEFAIERGDLDMVAQHVADARKLSFEMEYNPEVV